jgi:tagatose 6-phosphate kinase
MILTVTLNPAVDKVFVLSEENFRTFNRTSEVISGPGGGGINAAYSISALGGRVIATGFLGGTSGRFIENELWKAKITTNFVHVEEETRTDYVILNKKSEFLAHIAEPGPPITEDEMADFKIQYDRALGECKAVILSGSLPLGISPRFYKALLDQAKERNVLSILSSSNEVIRNVDAIPYCVHPEETKKRGYLFEAVDVGYQKSLEAIQDILGKGVRMAIVDFGKSAFIVANEKEVYQAIVPAQKLMNVVGMGNVFVGAFCHILCRGGDIKEAARYGAASAAASGSQLDGKVRSESQVAEYLNRVTLKKMEG